MNRTWNGQAAILHRRWLSLFFVQPGSEALEIRASIGRRGCFIYVLLWRRGYVIGPHYIVKDGT